VDFRDSKEQTAVTAILQLKFYQQNNWQSLRIDLLNFLKNAQELHTFQRIIAMQNFEPKVKGRQCWSHVTTTFRSVLLTTEGKKVPI
jgi:hypothetical protein